jgi:replicative DNA helicase
MPTPRHRRSGLCQNESEGTELATHAETLLISAVIRTGDFTSAIHAGLSKNLFHVHRDEWNWVERYVNRYRKTPGKATFKNKFPEFRIKAVDDVSHYADEVKQEHARYKLSVAIDKALAMAENDNVDQAVKSLHSELVEIQSRMEGESADFDLVKDYAEVYDDVKARVEKVLESGQAGIPTGFKTLDLLTSGPQPGDFWIVAARLGMGKTWTLVRMACAAMFAGHVVQYDALEQSKKQVAFRCHSFMSSEYGKEVFKSLDLHRGKGFDLRSYREFLRSLSKHVSGQMFISDTSRGRVSPLTIAAQVERNKVDAVYLDYLTLMEGASDSWRDTAKLSAEIKQLTTRYEIPVIAAAQINRTGAGKEPPKAEHIGLSDAIGQDADCVVTMAQQSKHVIKFRLSKYRHGQDGDIWYTEFSPNTGKFQEISGDRAEEIIEEDLEED